MRGSLERKGPLNVVFLNSLGGPEGGVVSPPPRSVSFPLLNCRVRGGWWSNLRMWIGLDCRNRCSEGGRMRSGAVRVRVRVRGAAH